MKALHLFTAQEGHASFRDSLGLMKLATPLAPLKAWAAELKKHTLTVYFTARDSRTPLVARLLAATGA